MLTVEASSAAHQLLQFLLKHPMGQRVTTALFHVCSLLRMQLAIARITLAVAVQYGVVKMQTLEVVLLILLLGEGGLLCDYFRRFCAIVTTTAIAHAIVSESASSSCPSHVAQVAAASCSLSIDTILLLIGRIRRAI